MTQDPLNLLCIEPRFPGRLGAVADWLVRHRGYRCWFYCASTDATEHWPASTGKGLEVVGYQTGGAAREPAVPWIRYLERGLCHAYGCWETLDSRRPRPVDLVLGRVVGHDGLGPALFLPELLSCPMVNYCEYYFAPRRRDISYRIDLPPAEPAEFYPRSINAATLVNLAAFAWGYSPTHWQRQTFPEHFRHKIEVHFDGIDTALYQPRRLPRTFAGRTIPADHRLVTFVARGLESMRGFDLFMRLAQRIARERPDVLFAVVGQDRSYYGWDRLHTGREGLRQLAPSKYASPP